MYLIRPWYILPSWPGSLRACMSCCPIQCMLSGRSEVTFIPKFLCESCVRILAELLDMWHISLVSLLMILTSFFMSGVEKGTA